MLTFTQRSPPISKLTRKTTTTARWAGFEMLLLFWPCSIGNGEYKKKAFTGSHILFPHRRKFLLSSSVQNCEKQLPHQSPQLLSLRMNTTVFNIHYHYYYEYFAQKLNSLESAYSDASNETFRKAFPHHKNVLFTKLTDHAKYLWRFFGRNSKVCSTILPPSSLFVHKHNLR